ncbi:SDR family NAD(P)-dependent oxidoreductase [Roseivivax isoporae]|uniref:3-hydroxy-2-methylbutyryl-CoA dehydrogenase n=1 Tax=Roseivivax isoporae LMG 25204 TaxID=1449351 RepID=X7F4D6_9RHOB|nr:SDR family NAD(P)-dependent oxidoreductase [Roseivivax isoporae]ETX27665.1 3-hydroxy-2-methylbutyryl-CoA dehydrogenase [Roseivivax isoporae LMG 25204]
MQVNGAMALVSGGGSGLGAATARQFARLGARVAVLDRNAEAAQAVADEIEGVALPVDVTDAAAVGTAVDGAVDALGGPLRIAVNCAGIAPAARVIGREGALATDLFRQVVEVNLIGSYNVMSHAVRHMAVAEALEDGERGIVVNTASIAWEDGQVGQSAYAASKGGIAALSLPAARDLARHGVRVVAIAPGLFHTPMMEGLPRETSEAIVANIPFPQRLGDPADFARLVVHAVENIYLNGTTIRLDAAVRLPQR